MYQEPSKAVCQQIHALRRIAERFGLVLDLNAYRGIIKLIQEGQSKFIHRQSNRVGIHYLVYENCNLYPVYDSERSTIVTFLTKGMVERYLTPRKKPLRSKHAINKSRNFR